MLINMAWFQHTIYTELGTDYYCIKIFNEAIKLYKIVTLHGEYKYLWLPMAVCNFSDIL